MCPLCNKNRSTHRFIIDINKSVCGYCASAIDRTSLAEVLFKKIKAHKEEPRLSIDRTRESRIVNEAIARIVGE